MQIQVLQVSNTLTPAIRRQIAALRNPAAAMKAMGTVAVSLTQRAFTDSSLRPSAWAPLSPKTIKRRVKDGRGTKPLLRTGTLSRSPRVISATATAVTIGSDRPYALYQQLGTRYIPARPFFPFTADGRPTAKARILMLAAATRVLKLRS